jgi:hypothetical protein
MGFGNGGEHQDARGPRLRPRPRCEFGRRADRHDGSFEQSHCAGSGHRRGVFTAQPGGDAGNLDWNPDGQLPAIPAYEEGQAIIVDRSGQEVAVLSDAVGVADVEFSPDGRLLATAGLPTEERPNGPAPRGKIWDWEKGETVTHIPLVAVGGPSIPADGGSPSPTAAWRRSGMPTRGRSWERSPATRGSYGTSRSAPRDRS